MALLALLRLADPGPLELVRLRWFDQLQQLVPTDRTSGRVVLIAIDDASLEAVGQWPWPRDQVAGLVAQLAGLEADAVALDILFADPDRLSPAFLADILTGADAGTRAALRGLGDNDGVLAAALGAVPSVLALALRDSPAPPPASRFAVLGDADRALAALPDQGGALANRPTLQAAARGSGVTDVFAEPDGVLRRVPGVVRVQDTLQPSLAVEAARLALGAESLALDAGPAGVAGILVGDRFLPTDPEGRFWLDASAPDRVPVVSAWDVLRGRAPAGLVAGRIAILGVAATGVGDRWQTPSGRIQPGPMVQALTLDSLLADGLPHRPVALVAVELLATLGAGLLLVAGLPRLRMRVRVGAAAALVAAPFGASVLTFAATRALVDATFPGLALLVLGAQGAYAAFRREEARRHAQERAALVAMRRLRDSIEVIDEGFALFGPDRRLVLCNARFRALAGAAAPGAAYGEVTAALAASGAAPLAAGGDPAGWAAARAAVFGADSTPREERTRGGGWLRIEERRTADGGLVALYADVSEARAREADLDEARRQAVEASRAKSDILANMSHELRTPLNAILGFSDIMRRGLFGPVGGPTYVNYLNDIFGSATHLLDLISRMLDLSRMEMGQVRPADEAVDLDAVAAKAARLVEKAAADAELTLGVEPAVADGPALVRADPQMVLQILLNLLSNAIKFTDAGGRVGVATVRQEGGLGLRVTDTGIGMAPEVLRRAVERFFWEGGSSTSRIRGGAGLGLALVKSFTDLHGARLDLDSEPGRGTTVTVLFPPERVVPPAG